jgi:predicted small lipoprotein YifL
LAARRSSGHYNFIMKTAILGSLLALAISMVIGCGMKGELVLPNEPESQDRARFPEVLIPSPSSNAPAKR